VDQGKNYVFGVGAGGVAESGAKTLSYWSTADGDDTMVTVWNPADEEQDFTFTLFFSGGHYLLPLHLGPRVTRTFNISEIVHNQIPDAEGNTIPLSVHEGSAQIAGSQGHAEHILVAIDAGIYNVRKATCVRVCQSCSGIVAVAVTPTPFNLSPGGTVQETFVGTFQNGTQDNLTGSSSWTTSNASVGTVSLGLVTAHAGGTATIAASYHYVRTSPDRCGNEQPPPCPTIYYTGQVPGTVQVPTFFDPQGFTPVTNACSVRFPSFPFGVGTIVHYLLTDQNHSAINMAGITPRENITDNGIQSGFLAFSTPSTTRSDGTFDDNFLASCSATPPPPNKCNLSSQAFDVLVPQRSGGTAEFPIKTTTSLILCTQGDSVTVNANDGKTAPVNFKFGTTN
jgi:hypothetical protein